MTLLDIETRNLKAGTRKSKLVNRPRRLRTTPAIRAMVRETETECARFYLIRCSCGMAKGAARSARCRACINSRWKKASVKRKQP